MAAILIGLVGGAFLGLVYVMRARPQIRRTLVSSILLGVFVGVLVELAREPLLGAVFAGVATIFLAEFIRWVARSFQRNGRKR